MRRLYWGPTRECSLRPFSTLPLVPGRPSLPPRACSDCVYCQVCEPRRGVCVWGGGGLRAQREATSGDSRSSICTSAEEPSPGALRGGGGFRHQTRGGVPKVPSLAGPSSRAGTFVIGGGWRGGVGRSHRDRLTDKGNRGGLGHSPPAGA